MSSSRIHVTVGGLSGFELLVRMEAAGIKLNQLALELLRDECFRTEPQPRSIGIVLRTLDQLGLPCGGTLSRAIDAAASLGYGLCPPELGPHFRLAYADQEEGAAGFEATPHQAPRGSVTVVDRRPNEDGADYRGFYLRRIEGALWLRGYQSWRGHIWQPQDTLAFAAGQNAA